MSELQAARAAYRARETEEKRQAERRRNALVLILRHLVDHGYTAAYERLSTECNLSLNKVDVADNVDLIRVVQEFEDSHELKYGRRPKLVRRVGGAAQSEYDAQPMPVPVKPPLQRNLSAGAAATAPSPPNGVLSSVPGGLPAVGRSPGVAPQQAPVQYGNNGLEGPPISGAVAAQRRRERGTLSAEDAKRAEALERRQRAMDSYKPPPEVGMQRVAGVAVEGGPVVGGMSREEVNAAQAAAITAGMQVQGAAMHIQAGRPGAGDRREGKGSDSDSDPDAFFERRVMKPLPASLAGELRDLGAAITRDIFTDNPNVRWDDIAGLDTAKRLLKEAVVQPLKYPELFTGLLAPWKGVLLYGPPGTGKTMLAKAVATECKTTFFNIQASTIISKWRGDSEKLVRVLFDLARYHAPSTVFLDEIDALMGARGEAGEHEASRRMKTELLIQMDGLAKSSALVFVLCATNLPWELDMAMLRRLEKRILVPLPSCEARARMFAQLLAGRCGPGVDPHQLAADTDGYSGSDVTLVAKEAAMRPLRRLMARLEAAPPATGAAAPGNAASPGARPQPEQLIALQLEPVSPDDVAAALAVTRPSARLHEARYLKFSEEYGSSSALT